MAVNNQQRPLAATPQRSAPIEIVRRRRIAVPPERVFAILSSPANLAELLPRVRRVEMLERSATRAHIVAHLALTPFYTIRADGEVRWVTNREICFSAIEPAQVEACYQLEPDGDGTQVRATLRLDLSSMLGALGALVPDESIVALATPDIDATLAALARRAVRSTP